MLGEVPARLFATLAAEIKSLCECQRCKQNRDERLDHGLQRKWPLISSSPRTRAGIMAPRCTTFPGSCQDMGICPEGFNHIRGRKALRLTASFRENAAPTSRSQQPSTPQPVLGPRRVQEISSTEVPQEHCPCKAETQSCFCGTFTMWDCHYPREVRTPLFLPGTQGTHSLL